MNSRNRNHSLPINPLARRFGTMKVSSREAGCWSGVDAVSVLLAMQVPLVAIYRGLSLSGVASHACLVGAATAGRCAALVRPLRVRRAGPPKGASARLRVDG